MTREEAIKILRSLYNVQRLDSLTQEEMTAVAMAIKALEQQPCDDCISRQAVLEYIEGSEAELGHSSENELVCQDIKELPPVTPKEKIGHWIKVTNGRGGHECDLCHEYAPSYQSGDEYLTKYCPNCGARMVEPQESEVEDKNEDT